MNDKLFFEIKLHNVIFSLWSLALSIFFIQTFFYTIQVNFKLTLFLAIIFVILTFLNSLLFFSSIQMYSFNFKCILIGQIILSIIAIISIVCFVRISNQMSTDLDRSIKDHLEYKRTSIFLNTVQRELMCCGRFSVHDYTDKLNGNNLVPSSCCSELDLDKGDKCPKGSEWREGCVQAFRKFTSDYKSKTITLILISTFWQLTLFIWFRKINI